MSIRAKVSSGRIIVNEPTLLPEGDEIHRRVAAGIRRDPRVIEQAAARLDRGCVAAAIRRIRARGVGRSR
jgi:hypothetical protein